jgi:hypothetical protein
MDSIAQRQQTERAKCLLRAYSAEYRRAKSCRSIRAGGAIVFAVAGPVAAVWSITATAYIAAAAGAWTVIVRVLLKRYESEAQHHAVRIHELFDAEVLGLPWSESLAGRKPAEEDVLKAARTVAYNAELTGRIDAGWFPDTPGVPPPVDSLIAQRASAVWGRRQHKLYSRLVLWVLGLAFIAVVVMGFVLRMELSTWLIVFILPGLPALLDGVELSQGHTEQGARKREVETSIDDAWKKELHSPGSLTVQKCRQIQDAVFRIRLEPVQIPEWYYNRHRSGDEEVMQSAAENLAAQYRDALARKRSDDR